ncbi:MAG: N-6 DNA methylase [Planctomycetes bacterium]|nr:N-6 DNA methylase [Planctomycetota bacterium]
MDPESSLLFHELDPIRYGSGRRRGRLIIERMVKQAAEEMRTQGYVTDEAHAVLVKWAELDAGGRLQGMTETALHAEFLTEVFGRALGYQVLSANLPQWELQPEYPVPGGQADAAIGKFTPAGAERPRALIELKGPTVDLDRDRSAGRTPVQQCWDYLNAVPECPWGIVSNYVSFRLYHRSKGSHAFEHFTLQELKNAERFRAFYALFGRGAFLPPFKGQRPRADRLLAESDARQLEVGDKLYDEYRNLRYALVHHLHTRRSRSVDDAIRIAQRLIDRVIFIAFCEDRGLLPPYALEDAWRNVPPFSRAANPRWQNFCDLFRSVDSGNDVRSIPPYDGGLFREDPEVDGLDLDDEWTNAFRRIGHYDFRDEVNVEVLGHLFERSITELERLRAGGLFSVPAKDDRPAAMPKSAQRKRFGVYYTPPAFTDLIVQLTIGALVDERFARIERQHGLPENTLSGHDGRRAPKAAWEECLDVLRNVKVCDPACGSGAFLIRAYDYFEAKYAEVTARLRDHGDRKVESLLDGLPDTIMAANLFGVDLSEEAVEISQLALWIRSARRGKTLADLSHNVVCGNSLVDDRAVDPRAMNWQATFPEVFDRKEGGFDCVIGNPPWERLKVQEREFFSLAAPKVAAAVSAATRRKMIAALERGDPELYERYVAAKQRAERTLGYTRESGRFPLTGKGDVNTYVLFAEQARSIVAPEGRVGLLMPSGIATDNTTKEFFHDLISSKSLICLYDFENRRRQFPDVDSRFKFCTLVFGGSTTRTRAVDFFFFAHEVEELAERKRHIPLSAEDFALVNPNTRTCPVFRTRRDAELTRRAYKRVPILVDKTRRKGGNPWGIKFFTMFHQTNDAELFHTGEQLLKLGYKLEGNRWRKRRHVFLPLYEAKMVQAYDHRAAGVIVDEDNWMRQGQTKATSLVSHQNPEFVVQPRWWVDEAEVDRALRGRGRCAYLCYKDVTSPTNERTMIAAFMPHVAVVNSAPLMLTGDEITPRAGCCLLANLNSFALDFIARQKVGNIHLNFFIVEQLPLFPPDAYSDRCPWHRKLTLERWISDRVLKLSCTAEDMAPLAEAAGFAEGIHKWKPAERAELRAELDAAFFHLYGLKRDDVEYVLSTFTGARRAEEDESGVHTPTDLILARFDEFATEG